MVARGDLGVEINVAEMPIEQKRIIRVCHRYERPVIIATQMLESMHESQRPTRAEVTDVANAVLDGADACMLSGETAIGRFPVQAVKMMSSIAQATEHAIPTMMYRDSDRADYATRHDVTRAVVCGAGLMAKQLKAKTLVVASHSGGTALALSQQRNLVPTIGVSTKESTLRKMCLYWGVTPLSGAPAQDMQELIRHSDGWARSVGLAKKGDRIVIVGGSHLTAGPDAADMAEGVHDVVVVHEVEGE
jgi:pyruvate kinase